MTNLRRLPSRTSGLIVLGVALILVGLAAAGMMSRGLGITLALMGALFFALGWRWRDTEEEPPPEPEP